ncbi:hypothetical protein EYF80_060832 [Liparis tanakae]|uniref:Uncharacterized protein n=1 Tax=Liparis tanakae TaxID=230148 RepID=A0A4Z2EKX7_9TELE|nr:hypothetical protein EYF80_060832 [Liparis tanakae]
MDGITRAWLNRHVEMQQPQPLPVASDCRVEQQTDVRMNFNKEKLSLSLRVAGFISPSQFTKIMNKVQLRSAAEKQHHQNRAQHQRVSSGLEVETRALSGS